MILKREPTDLNKLITEISEDVQRTTQRHNIVLELRNIPLVSADRERIGQVVTNLLTNAVKYSPEGGDIHVYSAKEDHHVKVTVIDKGIGISSDSQARIFERFYRTTNPAMSTYPGMGLGLYISAGIIHRHGGHVSVESKEGKGSVFSFKLPL
jgi:signal transduction histidine kinase